MRRIRFEDYRHAFVLACHHQDLVSLVGLPGVYCGVREAAEKAVKCFLTAACRQITGSFTGCLCAGDLGAEIFEIDRFQQIVIDDFFSVLALAFLQPAGDRYDE